MKREIPAQWLELMAARGLHSGRALALEMETSPETVQRMIHGGATSIETLEVAARVLKTDVVRLRQLRGEAARSPFHLPPQADRLTPKQREAVRNIVLSMIDPGDPEPVVPTEAEIDAEAETLLTQVQEQARQNGPARPKQGP